MNEGEGAHGGHGAARGMAGGPSGSHAATARDARGLGRARGLALHHTALFGCACIEQRALVPRLWRWLGAGWPAGRSGPGSTVHPSFTRCTRPRTPCPTTLQHQLDLTAVMFSSSLFSSFFWFCFLFVCGLAGSGARRPREHGGDVSRHFGAGPRQARGDVPGAQARRRLCERPAGQGAVPQVEAR